MDKLKIDGLLKKINFDDHYIEATFQFKLLMQLGKIYDEDKIFPERSIKAYNLKDYTKKEIDIVIGQENNSNIAIELKMPMNGQVPEQMFKFIEDIKFLEELSASKFFHKCYLIVVTNDKDFWQGNKNDGIYSPFRSNDTLKGKIYKPTGNIEIKAANYYELNGEYKIQWNNLVNGFRYFVIEIEYSTARQQDIKDFSLKPASEQIHSTPIFATKSENDIHNLWKKIVSKLGSKPIEIQTMGIGSWFSAYSKDDRIYIDNSQTNVPSIDLNDTRKINETEFSKVYPYYQPWKKGETKRKSIPGQNTSYILALINHFEKDNHGGLT